VPIVLQNSAAIAVAALTGANAEELGVRVGGDREVRPDVGAPLAARLTDEMRLQIRHTNVVRPSIGADIGIEIEKPNFHGLSCPGYPHTGGRGILDVSRLRVHACVGKLPVERAELGSNILSHDLARVGTIPAYHTFWHVDGPQFLPAQRDAAAGDKKGSSFAYSALGSACDVPRGVWRYVRLQCCLDSTNPLRGRGAPYRPRHSDGGDPCYSAQAPL
jgi:hypothetical protein